jgi:periplasmic protein TonB
MEQPIHAIRSSSSANTVNRTIALSIAVGLNLAFAVALNAGLVRTLVEKLPEVIKVDVVEEKIPDKAPPPPPPDMAVPPPPFVPPPDFQIVSDAPPPTNTITVQSKVAPPAVKQLSSPASVGRPHACGQDYYPAISVRLGEQGTTTLAFHIGVDGSVKDLAVAESSGSERLDEAAMKCASRWRYKPATGEGGQPIEVGWKSRVVWDLKNR